MRKAPISLAAGALAAAFSALLSAPSDAADAAGGPKAFSMPVQSLGPDDREVFAAGRRLFRIVWRPRAFSETTADTIGLGPLFNRHSCAGCHIRNGRGQPPVPGSQAAARGMIFRLGAPSPESRFGAQLQDQAVPDVDREGRVHLRYRERPGQFGDGAAFSLRVPAYAITGAAAGHALQVSPRVPPAIFGGGLLEAVDIGALRAAADPNDEDGDGISGRLAIIDHTDPDRIGRFGWKASRATLREQVIEAAAEDIGLASRERPLGGCTARQADTIPACSQTEELAPAAVEALVAYLRGLAAPARRNPTDPKVLRGEALFREAGCAHCHRPDLLTGDYPPMPALAGQTIHAYTDLLLHDMGEGLADHMPDGTADGREWRTPPLWGIGLVPTVNGHSYFLHDGRARSLMEAVLWHGGEAEAARRTVIGWSERDRAALIAFLKSL